MPGRGKRIEQISEKGRGKGRPRNRREFRTQGKGVANRGDWTRSKENSMWVVPALKTVKKRGKKTLTRERVTKIKFA